MIKYRTKLIEKLTHGKSVSHLIKTITGRSKPPEVVTCFGSYKVHTRPLLDWDVETPDGGWQTIKFYFTYSRNGGPIQRVMIDENSDDWEAMEALYAKIDTDLCRAQDGESLAFYILSDNMGLTEQVIPELNDIDLHPVPLPPIELNRMTMASVPEQPDYDYTITGIGGDGLIPIPNAFNIDSRNISIPHPCSDIDFETVDWSAWPRWYPNNTIVKEDNTIVIYPSEGIEPHDFDLFKVLGGVGNTPITINSCVKAVPNKYNCMASYVVGSQTQGLILARQALTESDVQSTEYREPVRFSDAPFPFKAVEIWNNQNKTWPPNDILEGGDYGQDWAATYRRNDGPLKSIVWNTGSRDPGVHHSVWDAIKELLLDDYGRTAFMLSDFNSTMTSHNPDSSVTVKSGLTSNLTFTYTPPVEGNPAHMSQRSYRYAGKSVEVRDRQIQFSDENAGVVWNENTITIYPTPLEVINYYGFDGHSDYYEYLCQYYDQLEAGEPITIHSCAAVEPADHIQVNTGLKIDMSTMGEVMPPGLIARVQINDGEIKEFAEEGEFMEKTIIDLLNYVSLLGADPIVTSSSGVNNDGVLDASAQSKTNLLYFKDNPFSRESGIIGCSGIERPGDFNMQLMNINMEAQKMEMLRVEILDDMDSDIPHVRASNKVTFHRAVGSDYVDFFDFIVGAKGNTHTIYSSAGVPCLLIGDPVEGDGGGGELPDPPIDPEPIENGFVFDLITDPTQTSVLTLIVSDPDPEWKLLRDDILLASSNYSGPNASVKKHSSFEEYTVQVTGLAGVDTTFSLHGSAEYVRLTTGANDYTRNKVTVTRFSDEIRRCNFSVWAMELTVPEYLPPVVDNLSSMFTSCNGFNQDISMWDVSNVTNMDEMFFGCGRFNQDLSNWCVAKIPTLPRDFATNSGLTEDKYPVWGTCPSRIEGPEEPGFGEHLILHSQGDIVLNAPVGSVLYSIDGGETWQENSEYGFTVDLPSGVESAVYLKSNDDVELTDSLNVRSTNTNTSNFKGVHQWWDSTRPIRLGVSDNSFYVPKVAPPNVTDMIYMFTGASAFNGDISQWDVSNVTSMSSMFHYARAFNGDISQWDVSNVTNMNNMFLGAKAFNSDISQWDVSNVTSMYNMFYNDSNASAFNSDISGWNVSNVTNMSSMFYGARAFNQDLSTWCVSNISSYPNGFASEANAWTLPKPIWGTCPPRSDGDVVEIGLRADYSGIGWYKATDTGTVFNKGIPALETHVFSDSPTEYVSVHTKEDALLYGERAAVSNITDMTAMFNSKDTFNEDISSWDVSNVVSMMATFKGATSFNQDLSNWDVSSVTNMSSLFYDATTFNSDISKWDVSKVTNMERMFNGAASFNQDISTWNVSLAYNMRYMFSSATSFNQPIGNWDISSAATLGYMFNYATSFNQDLSNWNVSSVVDMGGMFNGATTFNRDISKWDVSSVANMKNMFYHAKSFNSDLSSWNVSKVIAMDSMFYDANAFNSDLSNWNVSSVTNMALMFNGATTFNQDISSWDVRNVTDMGLMFESATAFNQDLSSWCVTLIPTRPSGFDTSATSWTLPRPVWGTCPRGEDGSGSDGDAEDMGLAKDYSGIGWYKATDTGTVFNKGIPALETHVFSDSPTEYVSVYTKDDAKAYGASAAVSNMTDMQKLFDGNTEFNQNISSWDVSNVTNMSGMFASASSFNQDLSSWDVSLVINTSGMFANAASFNSDISLWNVSSVNDMDSMFVMASSFNQDISGWNVSNVTSMFAMFSMVSSFNQDISNWNVSNVIKMGYMFNNASAFNSDISLWNVSSVNDMNSMFNNATAFNQDLSSWCVTNLPTKPEDFDSGASVWTLPKPVWGTCPRGENIAA